ncbi:DUF1036 domain-containing protein [Leisingera sp. ANG-M7]|uniref:DUF1036 domain-containing protein n=1 Tax=Leisingera sp. ANG-M7 TaxID=1577902 RepID=UPI00057DAE39|nr:DUF1036 domain-containing protein [Leisingera sp. ANG-M7]KIC35235.1 hypothetical protein RA26_18160 [Leisingera sp. ANG-M7]
MTKCLWLPALLLAALLDMTAAQAGPRICNDTEALHHLALVLRDGGSWVAQGWQHLHPGDCADPAPPEYEGKFLYFRAESPGYRFRHDSVRFCTAPDRFRIPHGGECTGQGQAWRRFAKMPLDMPAQQVLLSTRSVDSQGGAHAPEPDDLHHAAEGVQHYTGQVVFQGCRLNTVEETVTCKFIGNGMEIGSDGRLQINDPVFTYLLGLLRGTPLEIDGEMTSSFGSFGELDLHSVTPRIPNRFDKILQKMQGVWQSERSPLDRFSISGAVRRVSYAGRRMTPEFVSVQDNCQGTEGSDFLLAWDSLRGSSLCYQIKSLTDERMTLVYLPRGIRLDYQRVP